MKQNTFLPFSLLVATISLAACAHNDFPPTATPMDFPCFGDDKPCAKLSVRAPVTKALNGPLNGNPDRGKAIAFGRDKGNCLACHAMNGGTQMGTRGPDLTRYGAKGRTDAETFTMIYDMRAINPNTVMPPMGTNMILSEQDIRDVVAFLQAAR